MARIPAFWLLVVCLMVAGCAAQEAAAPAAIEGGQVPEDLGEIRGTVTDDNLAPLAGVDVSLDGSPRATTDEGGAYVIDRILPGTYTLSFRKESYGSVDLKVDVIAGEVTRPTVAKMVAGAFAGSYYTTEVDAGFDQCSVNVVAPWGEQGWPLCEFQFATQSFDNLKTFIPHRIESLAPVGGFWGETKWQATQVLGDSLRVSYLLHREGRVTPDDKLQEIYIVSKAGASPNQVRFVKQDVYNTTSNGGFAAATTCEMEGACEIIAWHHAARSQSVAESIGFQYEQRFDHYFTTFYGAAPPEVFSALADA